MSISDSQRLLRMLTEAREEGVHSHTIRRSGISGNPSQRAKDLVTQGVHVFTARENRGRRPGSRYWTEPFAPDFAVAVKGNRAESSEPTSTRGTDSTEAGLSSDAASEAASAAQGSADAGGQLFDLPEPGPESAVTGRRAA